MNAAERNAAMTHTVLADTGPLYAAADPSDQYHERARAQLHRLERERIWVAVSYPTLLETHSLIVRRLGPAVATTWFRELRDGAGIINPLPDDYDRAYRLTTAYADQSITLFDAVLAVLSQRLHFPVWTYDYHFDVMRIAVWR